MNIDEHCSFTNKIWWLPAHGMIDDNLCKLPCNLDIVGSTCPILEHPEPKPRWHVASVSSHVLGAMFGVFIYSKWSFNGFNQQKEMAT